MSRKKYRDFEDDHDSEEMDVNEFLDEEEDGGYVLEDEDDGLEELDFED